MAKEFKLIPIPGGPFDQFVHREKIPKDSNKFLYNLVDIYGSENIVNMSEVGIGDYVYNKGIIHSMNMNVGRNIPWVEDGLKSVERRVLYVMWKKGYYKKKSAKVSSIVGDMISLVYPHGEMAPAETIYRLGRSKSMMLPYVQELSNYGNMQDLKPAAPRYAKAALSDYAYDCFFGEVGPKRPLYDVRDNYTYTDKEPIYLISRYPNILMQWNLGIGKGAMSWLGAFNSTDIFKTTLLLIDDPNAKVDIYPDAPVPVDIVNKAELKGCFDKKSFKVKMHAPFHAEIDRRKNGSRLEDKYVIVFTALPLGVTGNQIRDEIASIKEDDAKKTANKRLPEVLNVEIDVNAEKAGPGGIRLIVEYERGYDPIALAEKLYKSTSLAKTIGVKYNLISNNQPGIWTPREILLMWINQRYDQKRRYYHQMVLKAAKDRAMYDALTTILETKDATDKAINLIRGVKDNEAAITSLRKAFGFTDFQARVIIKMQLGNLSKMNVEETIRKRDNAVRDYKHYRKLLSSEEAIKGAVREELEEGLAKYGKSRVAKLKNLKMDTIGEPTDSKYLLYNNEFYYCFDDPARAETIWSRVDNSYHMVKIKNGDNTLVFNRNGMLKILNGYAFTLTDGGIAMNTLGITDVVAIMPDNPAKGYSSVVMVTEQGYGKAMEMLEVTKSVKSRVINLNSGDHLAAVVPIRSDYHPDSLIGMIQGDKMYYLKVGDFPVYKRSSAGNRVIKNVKDLKITGAIYFDASENPDYILIYGESGYLKLLDASILPFSKRGINVVSLQNKRIIGATLIHGVEDYVHVYGAVVNGISEVKIQIGKMVKFTASSGEEQRFKMSTTIGTPVKVLKVSKNEWYAIQ